MNELAIHENAEPGRHGVQEITAYFREGVERNGKNSLWARRAMPSSPARIQGKHRFRARASRTDLLPIFPHPPIPWIDVHGLEPDVVETDGPVQPRI